MRLQLKVDENGIITETAFKVCCLQPKSRRVGMSAVKNIVRIFIWVWSLRAVPHHAIHRCLEEGHGDGFAKERTSGGYAWVVDGTGGVLVVGYACVVLLCVHVSRPIEGISDFGNTTRQQARLVDGGKTDTEPLYPGICTTAIEYARYASLVTFTSTRYQYRFRGKVAVRII